MILAIIFTFEIDWYEGSRILGDGEGLRKFDLTMAGKPEELFDPVKASRINSGLKVNGLRLTTCYSLTEALLEV
ncbi:MAG: hypothetical protein ACRD82_12870 [Blastocatellia bacterium]